ncbi:FHA domain-containing protein [Marinimicrobium sp. ABcell2]|uniref:FHA domain-containing protein n=1 Tax=Marinimicrobium sp. ABcell2 TaxID=3069751 RepID=UPI0027B44EFC|nr:FHA domain-containing protein [Marinimicrobium sp. ABcell2]MDQ2077691.1 FHA domain-containing protein [Marinimicrobium sp. ABcell2]
MLKLQLKDRRQDPVWVAEKLYSIGSAPDNHLVLPDESISPVHARLITTANKVYLKDNNSPFGCYVNEQRITQKEIQPGDVIRLGSIELEVLAPTEAANEAPALEWHLVADGGWLAGKSYAIPRDRPATIGRADVNDIVIPGSHLSRRHAQVQVQGDQLLVEDLDSVSGTYVNEQLASRTPARSGDRLRIDVYSFRIVGPEHAARPKSTFTPLANLKPLARVKPDVHTPKRWKTRPTSPGNREEPKPHQRQELWLWVVLIVTAILLIGGLYWI